MKSKINILKLKVLTNEEKIHVIGGKTIKDGRDENSKTIKDGRDEHSRATNTSL